MTQTCPAPARRRAGIGKTVGRTDASHHQHTMCSLHKVVYFCTSEPLNSTLAISTTALASTCGLRARRSRHTLWPSAAGSRSPSSADSLCPIAGFLAPGERSAGEQHSGRAPLAASNFVEAQQAARSIFYYAAGGAPRPVCPCATLSQHSWRFTRAPYLHGHAICTAAAMCCSCRAGCSPPSVTTLCVGVCTVHNVATVGGMESPNVLHFICKDQAYLTRPDDVYLLAALNPYITVIYGKPASSQVRAGMYCKLHLFSA